MQSSAYLATKIPPGYQTLPVSCAVLLNATIILIYSAFIVLEFWPHFNGLSCLEVLPFCVMYTIKSLV